MVLLSSDAVFYPAQAAKVMACG